MKNNGTRTTAWIVYLLGLLMLSLVFVTPCLADVPVIGPIEDDSSSAGVTYTKQPSLTQGSGATWTKLYGPDDLTVNASTGAVSWTIPSNLARESFYVGVRATNSEGRADRVWILKVGGGSYRYVGSGQTYSTITAATAAASSGDTIVVKAGTYTGAPNQMINYGTARDTLPPSGSSSIGYTTCMAEYPGAATLDGGTTYTMIQGTGKYNTRNPDNLGTYDLSYIAFKGFVITGSSSIAGGFLMNHASHIKLTHALVYEGQDDGSPIEFMRGQYNLIENCATWGRGRIGILMYLEDYAIMRRCITRSDYSNATNPMVGFDAYAVNYFRGQNLINVDSKKNMPNATYDGSGFCMSVGAYGTGTLNNKTSESIMLNHEGRFLSFSPNPGGTYGPVSLENVVGYDIKAKNFNSEGIVNPIVAAHDGTLSHVTLGKWSAPDGTIPYNAMINAWGGNQSITYSIMFDFKQYGGATIANACYAVETLDHINYYGVGNLSTNGGTPTNTSTSNPQSNGLLYLPRIEPGSVLATAGEGATVLYMRGKSGTLWGETGYDTLTDVPMWPFPMEDLIKTKMCAYNLHSVNGNRGFCVGNSKDGTPQTLTKYIWEYLGNQIPAQIYGGRLSPPSGLQIK
jgi:hypothetical protein